MASYGIKQLFSEPMDIEDFYTLMDYNKEATTPVDMGFIKEAPYIYQPLGFDTSYGIANEPDVEQVDYLGLKPNTFQQGIGSLIDLYKTYSPIGMLLRGLESIQNRIDTRRAIKEDIARDTQGIMNTITSPRIMNIQATPQDIYRGGGGENRSYSSPAKTSQGVTSAQHQAFRR